MFKEDKSTRKSNYFLEIIPNVFLNITLFCMLEIPTA